MENKAKQLWGGTGWEGLSTEEVEIEVGGMEKGKGGKDRKGE